MPLGVTGVENFTCDVIAAWADEQSTSMPLKNEDDSVPLATELEQIVRERMVRVS